MPAGWAAGAGALAGGLLSAGGAEAGAQQQAAYERAALAQQESMWTQQEGNEQPFVQGGQGAESQLNYLMGEGTPGQYTQGLGMTAGSSSGGGFGSLNAPFTADTFKSMSPAYQFQLQQGGQGTLNVDSSGQGAESGSALKDLQSYNQNFANTSFNNAFNQYQTQQNNVFSRLSNLATLGSSAGSNTTTGAGQFSGQIGNTTAGIGSALGTGSVAAGNALGSSANSLGGLLSGNNGFTGSTTAYNPGSYTTSNPGDSNYYTGPTQEGGP
jgi:hypothetical protein